MENSHFKWQHILGEMFIASGHSFQQKRLGGDLTSFWSHLTSHSVEREHCILFHLAKLRPAGRRQISDKDKEDCKLVRELPRFGATALEAVSLPLLGTEQG